MASIKNNLGRFSVSSELLREMMALPEHAHIERVYAHPTYADTFVFVVDCDDLEGVNPGEIIPEYSPLITADYDKKPSTWLTFEFGKRIG